MVIGVLVIFLMLVIFGFGVFAVIEGIRCREMFTVVVGLIFIGIVIIPILTGLYDSYQKGNATLKTEDVVLQVAEKKYTPEHTQIIPNGKSFTTVYHSESWNVTFTDGENVQVIDDEGLYNALNEGDKIKGYKDTYVKSNNSIYKVELRLK